MKNIKIIITLIILSSVSCISSRETVLESLNYNANKNQTEYMVFPFGNATIPGKWDKTHYNSVSKQQSFINEDSIKIAIAFGSFTSFEFNQDGSKKGFEFVKAYYEWDSKYLAEKNNFNREILYQDSTNNFIIWRIQGTNNGEPIDNVFLFGIKNRNVSNLSIFTDKWDINKKTQFLKGLFMNK